MILAPGVTGPLGNIMMGVGVNLTMAGVAELLAPGPETDHTPLEADDFKDQLFNGPVNVSKQGIPIPLLYGELIVGGAGIATDFNQTEAELQEEDAGIITSSFDDLVVTGSSSLGTY